MYRVSCHIHLDGGHFVLTLPTSMICDITSQSWSWIEASSAHTHEVSSDMETEEETKEEKTKEEKTKETEKETEEETKQRKTKEEKTKETEKKTEEKTDGGGD